MNEGFKIVQPSAEIMERFDLPENATLPDVTIEDRQDRQGVWIIGNVESSEPLASVLRMKLFDVIIRKRQSLSGQTSFFDVEFPAASKEILDDVRSNIVPTLKKHHYYRACGFSIESYLEMAEKLLQKGQPTDEVNRIFREAISKSYSYEGDFITLEHVKLLGKTINLGSALIETVDYNDGSIRLSRVIRSQGVYDGLNTPKEIDDKAVTEAKFGEWYLRTSYFSKNGDYKGTYVNLNTPVEVYPDRIRYVDLEVDVCFLSSGDVKIVDEDKLLSAVDRDIISEKLVKLVNEKAHNISKERIL